MPNARPRPYAGETKQVDSFLSAWDHTLVARAVLGVPPWVRPHHLTLLTLLWSALVLVICALARGHPNWLWAMSLVVALQYITDAVDGKVAVLREAGLVRWGFYMDHLLDYVFLCSVLCGYAWLLPAESHVLMLPILAIAGGFMVASFLACAVTGELRISVLKLGPLEMRLVFIAINTWLATVKRGPVGIVLPCVIGLSLAVLCAFVYQAQHRLWRLDAEAKRLRAHSESPAAVQFTVR